MILTPQDKQWLREHHPALRVGSEGISGVIRFSAVYAAEANTFYITEDGVNESVAGERLHGELNIRLTDRPDQLLSRLPALHVDGIDPTPPRHFNQSDKSACLCSPFEEQDILDPTFDFRKFIRELVIPFLYGQVYFNAHGCWPWGEYGHGALGLLESYGRVGDPGKAQTCLEKLVNFDKNLWPSVKAVLQQRGEVRGHMACLCPSGDHIRRCHPEALTGIRCLRRDIATQNLILP